MRRAASIGATSSLPADIDLYLQRKHDDGTWSADIFRGGSAEVSRETMQITRRLQLGTTASKSTTGPDRP